MATAATLSPAPLSAPVRLKARAGLTLLVAYCALLFLYGLGDRDLNASHEARAAQNAQSILDGGGWLLPRLFDGHVELQKPPLYYWLVASLGLVNGGRVDVWCVRLPAAASALGCVLLLYLLARRCGRPLAGLLAAAVLASCLHFTWLARVGRIDMPLTLAVTAGVACFYPASRRRAAGGRGTGWSFAGYTALALGVLLKGPIALVLTALVLAAHFTRAHGPSSWLKARHWRRSTLWWGVPWVLLVAGPWFVWANVETDGKLWDVFFWHHNLERGLGGSETLSAHPWWYYLPRGAVDLLPWSLALPAAVWWWFRSGGRDGLGRLGLLWAATVVSFLSCMSFKRADYLLPAYPGVALFLGCVAEELWQRRRAHARWAGPAAVSLCAAYGLAWTAYNTWVVPRQEGDWPYQQIARELRGERDVPVIFFRAESHTLAFHLGGNLGTVLEWENLQVWAGRPFPVYVVMPEDCARDWPAYLGEGRLDFVLRSADRVQAGHDHPFVVFRSRGQAGAGP